MTAGADRGERQDELLVDWSTGADLGDGLWVAWLVDADGARCPYIVDRHPDAPTDLPSGREVVRLAPHERTGRLPADVREALGLIHRCGALAATTGRPCRNRVARPGDRCDAHRDQPAAATGDGGKPSISRQRSFDAKSSSPTSNPEQLRLLEDEGPATP
jgi:hypothetical protein